MRKATAAVWSVALAIAMLLTFLPVSAAADGSSYDAYYYILDPDAGTESSRDADDFTFIGQGAVSYLLGRADGQNRNQTIPITSANEDYVMPPAVGVTQTFGNQAYPYTTYPDIVYKGTEYTYEGNQNGDSAPHTYSIVWYRYSSSDGFNIGSTPFGSGAHCWHVDGRVVLSDKVSVTYKVQFPGATGFSSVSANGKPSTADFVDYVEPNKGFSDVEKPNMSDSLTYGNVVYGFSGWYYDEECTEHVGADDKISTDTAVYGKYTTSVVSGESTLNIEVYLDGDKVPLTDDNWNSYLSDVSGVGAEAGMTGVDGSTGLLECSFDYNVYNAADLKLTPADGYVIQGVYGTFIYGVSGWHTPSISGGAWTVDNVQGESTLRVYLNTPYTVRYIVPDGTAPADGSTYISAKALDNFKSPNFIGIGPDSSDQDKSDGKPGGWVDNTLHTVVTLKDVPEGYSGWYTTEGGGTRHSGSYTGAAIKTAAGSNTVIECYATKDAPALSVEKTVTSVGGTAVTDQDSIPAAIAGDVIEYKLKVKNTGNVALSGIALSDSLWASGDVIRVDGSDVPMTGGSCVITSLAPGGEAVITYSHTVTAAEAAAGEVVNNASAECSAAEGESSATVRVNGTITITPADITIYMGGSGGYDAVVGQDGNTATSDSMPEPLFYVDPPGSADAEDVVLSGDAGRKWELVQVGADSSGNALYRIDSTGFDTQEPVRVTYTGSDGKPHISDSFDPAEIHELYAAYEIAIYAGKAGNVTASIGGERYSLASGTGTLRVRAVEDSQAEAFIPVKSELEGPVTAGEAAILAPEDTSYTLNDTTVPASSGVGLLFDSIIDTDANRTGALLDAIEDEYNINITNGNYQAQYLDLVDANNGNAWVKADGNVTVYWGYPAGTDADYTLYHFKDLHRDGENSGFDIADIGKSEIEVVDITKTELGIAFEVEPGCFSPFVLVWSEAELPEDPLDEPTEEPDNEPSDEPVIRPEAPEYTPNWLNTEDHFGYIIGYEDGSVKPNAGITRAEVATIFSRLLTDEARESFWSETNGYSDVVSGSWYNNAISTLSAMGILGGYEDGTFRPNASITRAEFAKMAVSFFEYEVAEDDGAFSDVESGAWYARYVTAAAELGLIEGYGGGLFRPDATITRAEACAIINRTLGRAPDAGHLLDEAQMNIWPDNSDPTAWYYAHIQEATNSHSYRRLGDIEQWTAKLPEPDWDELQG